jgi:hypothetical protein
MQSQKGVEVSLTSFLEGVGGQHHKPVALPSRNRCRSYFVGGWLGPGVGLDGWGKISPPGFDPRIFHCVATCYTDRAFPAHLHWVKVLSIPYVSNDLSAFFIKIKRVLELLPSAGKRNISVETDTQCKNSTILNPKQFSGNWPSSTSSNISTFTVIYLF